MYKIANAVFQSTHPYRVRQGLTFSDPQLDKFQSTHPYRVRRYNPCPAIPVGRNFNPRTRTGCDYCWDCLGPLIKSFQSTHPYRVRHVANRHPITNPVNFNPRTRTGCDQSYQRLLQPLPNFNPRTRTGCDSLTILYLGIVVSISIHAPVQGATSALTFTSSTAVDFNPRTRTGCDAYGSASCSRI